MMAEGRVVFTMFSQPESRRLGCVCGVVVVVTLMFFLWAIPGSQASRPEPPSGYVAAVAGVPDGAGKVSRVDFDLRRRQVRAERKAIGVKGSVSVGEESLRQLLEEVDIEGEARLRGITVRPRQVSRELRAVKEGDFASIGEFRSFLRRLHLTEAEARQRIRLQVLLRRIEDQVTAKAQDPIRAGRTLRKFVQAYLRRWRSVTICQRAIATDRCANGPRPASGASLGVGIEEMAQTPQPVRRAE